MGLYKIKSQLISIWGSSSKRILLANSGGAVDLHRVQGIRNVVFVTNGPVGHVVQFAVTFLALPPADDCTIRQRVDASEPCYSWVPA